MADAKRDAKLSLKFDNVEALRGMKELAREASSVEEAVAKIGKRYGDALSNKEVKRSIAAERATERFARSEFEKAQREREAAEGPGNAEFSSRIAGRMGSLNSGRIGHSALQGFRTGGIRGAIRGGVGAMASPLGIAGAGVAAVLKMMETVTPDINLYNRNDLTGAQKTNYFLDKLPGHETFRKFIMAIDGTTEALRRASLRLEERQLAVSIRASNTTERNAMRGTMEEAQARAGALAGGNVSALQTFDRWTMAGQQAFEEYQTILPAQDAAMMAERGAVGARRANAMAAGRYEEARVAYAAARGRRRLYEGRERGFFRRENETFERDQGGRGLNLNNLTVANQQEAAAFEEMIRRRHDLERAGVSAAEAEHRARQANLEVMKAELSILQQREQRLMSAANRIGSMNPIEQQLGLAAADQISQYGIQNVSPEVRQRAQSFAPEWYSMQATRYGETTDVYQQGRARGYLPPGTESIDDTRRAVANLQQQVREATLASEQQLAQTIADAIARAFAMIGPLLDERIDQALRRLRTGRAIQTNQQY